MRIARPLLGSALATVALILCLGVSPASGRVLMSVSSRVLTATGPYTDIGPVEGNTLGGATVNFSSETASTAQCDHSPGFFPVGTTTVNCTGDPAGAGSFNVIVVDTTPPTIASPGNQTAEATSAAGATVSFTATATDVVDGSFAATCVPASGSTFAIGTTPVTCNATDAHGNAAAPAAFNVTVSDTTGPALSLPSDQTVEATSSSGAPVNYSASASDTVDGSVAVNCSPASGSIFVFGLTTVSCSATDAHSNTTNGSFTVTVHDTTPPTVTVPASVAVTTTDTAGTVVTYSASASDNIDGPLTPTCSPASGSTFPVGTTHVTCSATDGHGNTGSAGFDATVTFVDNVAPTLNLPLDITKEATGPNGATATFTVGAVDNVDPNPTVACDHASGATFAITKTTVSCTATDASGNKSTGSFAVTVQDTTPPSLTVPGDLTAEATSASGAVVNFTVSATDIADPAPSVSCGTHASGNTYPLGTTTVSCTATDAAGNHSDTKTFHVIVQDTTPPVLNGVPSNMTAEATSSSGAVVTWTAPTANDSVDGSVSASCSPTRGSTFPLGTTSVTCSASDTHNNKAQASFNVQVVDTTAPTLTIPVNMTKEASGPGGAAVTFAVTAHDLVDSSPTVSCNHASGDTFAVGTTTVTCTARDHIGNTSAAQSFTVKIQDTVAPALTSVPANITGVEATGPGGAAVSFTKPTATDVVDGSRPVSCSPAPGATFAIGTTRVTCSASDASGNQASASFNVTVKDSTPPSLVGVSPDLTREATGPSGAAVTWTAPTASDTVDGKLTPTCTPASGSAFALGQATVTCSATDGHGNKTSKSFTVTVRDTTPPAISAPNVTREANGPTGSIVNYALPGALDAVDGPIAQVNCSPAPGLLYKIGSTTVTCNASDSRGNTSTVSFTLKVADTTAPHLIVPGDVEVYADTPDGALRSSAAVQAFLARASASDLVDQHPTLVNDAPGLIPVGRTYVTFTATDSFGNKATAVSKLVVLPMPAAGTTPTPLPPPPDRTPPPTPARVNTTSGENFIQVSWAKSSVADLKDYVVTREDTPLTTLSARLLNRFVARSADSPTPKVVYQGTATSFRDRDVAYGVEYRYSIVAEDTAGNKSLPVVKVAVLTSPLLVTPKFGQKVKAPPRLTWRRVPDATYYNVQLFRGQEKILSAWPVRPTLRLTKKWRYNGKTYRLTSGVYRWWVFPGFGARADVRYGALLGSSMFQFVG